MDAIHFIMQENFIMKVVFIMMTAAKISCRMRLNNMCICAVTNFYECGHAQ